MEKSDMIKILAILVVVGFLTEIFYFGIGSRPIQTTESTGINKTGVAVFNGTIRTYDPLLVISVNTSQAVIDQVRLQSGVQNIRLEPDGYVIDTETRDDVFAIASFLRDMNVSSLSIANVAVTDNIPVETATGIENATAMSGVVRVVTEPLLDVDSEVSVYMIAVVNDGILIDYRSAQIMMQPVDIPLEVRIASLDSKTYMYSIPWESRDSLGNMSGYGSASYRRLDTVVFTAPLTVGQIMVKKQFPYITYIDASSAQVEPSFTNVSEIALNFQDVNYTLPASTLVITTMETPDLPFNGTVAYSYRLDLSNSSSQYDFGSIPLVFQTDKEHAVDETLALNVTALVIGDKVVSLKSVSLPS